MRTTKNKRTGRHQLRFRDSNGDQQCFTSKKDFPTGITQRQADAIADGIYNAHEDFITGTARPYLSDCVERMLDHLENTGVKGIEGYRNHASKALEYDRNNTIDDIVKVCINLRDDMLKNGKSNGTPYSNNTIIQRMKIFQRTANLAYQEWEVLDLPLGGKMRMPKKPKARTRFLSVDECFNLINECEDNQTSYILELYALTGIRHAELERMADGDILNSKITIDGKNGDVRSFAISEAAMNVAEKITFPIERTYDQLYKFFCDAKDKAGIEDFGMHDLRHTFASWLAQSGDVSLHQLQQVMGHKQMNQTINYAHLMPEHLDNVAVKLKLETSTQNSHKL